MVRIRPAVIRPVVAALVAVALLALLLALRGRAAEPVTVLALPAPGATTPAITPAPPGRAAPATAAGLTSAPPAGQPPSPLAAPPAATASAAAPDARALLAALDRARVAAFADPPRADPDRWAAPACRCHADDVHRLRALARDGLALRGHAPVLLAVRATRSAPARLDLAVTDRLGAYAAVDRRGRVVSRWPASGPRGWRVTLVRTAGTWRIGALARAP